MITYKAVLTVIAIGYTCVAPARPASKDHCKQISTPTVVLTATPSGMLLAAAFAGPTDDSIINLHFILKVLA